MKKFNDIQELSYNIYTGKKDTYSLKGEDVIRKKVADEMGIAADADFKTFRRAFLRNPRALFDVLEDVITPAMGVILTDQLNQFVDVIDTELNTKRKFIFNDPSLFRVGVIANGNTDIRRQTIFNGSFDIETERLGVKVYGDFHLFMLGMINLTDFKDRVLKSFTSEIGSRVANSIYGAFDASNTPYMAKGTFDEATLLKIISAVKTDTGATTCKIYGTQNALAKVKGATELYSNEMKNQINLFGYIKQFQGTPMIEIPQCRLKNKKEYALKDDFLIVVPDDEKIVKVILEGDVEAYESDETARNDMQLEFFFSRMVGVGVAKPAIFGMYQLA